MLVFIYFLFAYFTLLFYRFLWFRALNQAMTVLKYVVIIILMGHNSNARNYQIINFLTSHYIQFGQAFTGSIVEHPVNLPMNPGQQSGTSSQVELSISLSSSPSFFFLLYKCNDQWSHSLDTFIISLQVTSSQPSKPVSRFKMQRR